MVWFLVQSWSEPISFLQSALQGLLLGPILFNIILSDLFFILNDIDIACYVDDNTLYKTHGNVDAVSKTLRMSAEKLFKWLRDNELKRNRDKCHLILTILTGKNCVFSIQYKNSCLAASDLFHMFTQSMKFFTFHDHILKSTDV